MDILFLLIPLSLVLGFAIGVAAWYAVGSGQFDDLDRPSLDLLADDDRPIDIALDGDQLARCAGRDS